MNIHIIGSSSAGNCYVLQDSNSSLILDAGCSPTRIIKQWGAGVLKQAAAVLITHEHADHSKYARAFKMRGVPAVCSRGTAKAIQLTDYVQVIAGNAIRIDKWTIMSFTAQHDSIEPLGYFISSPSGKKIAYITDTGIMPHKLHGCEIAIIECSYVNEVKIPEHRQYHVINGHLGAQQAINWIAQHPTIHTAIAVHLSDDSSDESEIATRAKQFIPDVKFHIAPKHGNMRIDIDDTIAVDELMPCEECSGTGEFYDETCECYDDCPYCDGTGEVSKHND